MYDLFKRAFTKTERFSITEEFLKSRPVRNPNVKWTRTQTGEIGIRPSTDEEKVSKRKKMRLITLDSIGSFVWNRCTGEQKVDDIAKGLRKEYGMTLREAEVALGVFLEQLSKKQLLKIIPPELNEKEKIESKALRRVKIP